MAIYIIIIFCVASLAALTVRPGRHLISKDTHNASSAYVYAVITGQRLPQAEKYIARGEGLPRWCDKTYYVDKYIERFREDILRDLADPRHVLTPIDELVIEELAKAGY